MKLETITVTVTQEDIDKGIRIDCRQCPIARAVNRLLKDEYEVKVVYSLHFYRKGTMGKADSIGFIYLPGEATTFIRTLDHPLTRKVVPFSFDLVIDSALQGEWFKPRNKNKQYDNTPISSTN